MDPQTAQELAHSRDFVAYLQTMVNLDILDRVTTNLDQELADSQRAMADIKSMFDSLSKPPVQNTENEDLSKFLEAGAPKLLLPDMVEAGAYVDLDSMITSMRGYIEEINKNIVLSPSRLAVASDEMQSLDLTPCAQSLHQLSKRLGNIKLNNKQDGHRDLVLEENLSQLCQDVDMFTQVVQTKTKLSGTSENWNESQLNGSALQYEDVVNKLLSGINEVTYILQHNNLTDSSSN